MLIWHLSQVLWSSVAMVLALQKQDQESTLFYKTDMKVELQTKPEELMKKFSALKSKADVADLLEIEESFLNKILYGIEERKKYKTFEIHKKAAKKRQISAPPKNIAILQSKLNSIITLVYNPKPCVHGFTKKRSICSNAKPHTSKRHIINIDLKDFFPSIHLGRIRGALKSKPFQIGKEASEVIAQICCMDDGILPQGGATSPIISNIICRSLDNKLMVFARNNRCQYTRYADDITFSSSSFHLPKGVATLENGELILSPELVLIIKKQDFKINPDKTRYTAPFWRQDVTGLTVNEFPNIRRSYIKSIMGALYAWEKHGYNAASRVYLRKYQPRHHSGINLKNVLKGKIAFVKMVLDENSPLFRKLARRYNNLSDNKFNITSIENIEPSPLRGEQPKTQVWNKWFNKYKDSVLFIETNNKGDKGTATAFYIGKNFFGTAGHNLKYRNSKLFFGDSPISIDKYTPYDDKVVDVGIIKTENKNNENLVLLPTQMRLPEVGEEVAAIGYPCLPQRSPTLVMHVGTVEALPVTQNSKHRFIQVSFPSGGGLSGGCLLDKGGFVIGVMVENIYNMGADNVPNRPYGQALPVEYLHDKLAEYNL